MGSWGARDRRRAAAAALAHVAGGTPISAAPDGVPSGAMGATRNAVPAYDIPDLEVTRHRLLTMPLRTSSLRSLGAFLNVFAIESFMDELALAADATRSRSGWRTERPAGQAGH